MRTLLGALFGWMVWRSGSILPAVVAHAVYDSTTVGIAYGVGSLDAAVQSASAALSVTDMVMLAVGAVAIVGGAALCGRYFRESEPVTIRPIATDPRPA